MAAVLFKLRWVNSCDARDEIDRFGGQYHPCLLMHWLLKSPEHQQAWYWLCRTDIIYCCFRVNFTYLVQAKSKLRFKMLIYFLAATKQLYEWYFLSVCPSVCPSHLFDYVPIIVSSWNFQELSPRTRVTSMQKVKVRGQRSRSQRSQPNLAVSGL